MSAVVTFGAEAAGLGCGLRRAGAKARGVMARLERRFERRRRASFLLRVQRSFTVRGRFELLAMLGRRPDLMRPGEEGRFTLAVLAVNVFAGGDQPVRFAVWSDWRAIWRRARAVVE